MFTSVFLLNIIYFSVCLTSNKLYWIDDQLVDVSTRFYTSASWSVGELTVIPYSGDPSDIGQDWFQFQLWACCASLIVLETLTFRMPCTF